jgi:hypothetical protein
MNKPITSRIKRSPLLSQAAGAIDPDDPNVVTVGGVTQGPDTTETVEVKRKPTGVSYKEAYKNADKSKYPTFESFKKAAEDWNAKNATTTETKTKPGEKTTWEGTLKEKTTGDVMQPWEVRRMSRSIKKEQRDIRRAKQKLARAKKRGNTARADEAQAELDEFKKMAERNKKARASGKRTGTSDVTTGQKDMLQSTLTVEQQKKFLEEKAKRDAVKKDITTPDEKPKSGAAMNPSAFKMYGKSPATKKLKGAQNTLPQHLQDAIKAAPGKMRGPLKKGYFKKY